MNECPWDLVEVHWTDAFDNDDTWTNVATYRPEPACVVTVGYLWVDCLPGYLTTVSSYMPDEVADLKQVGGVSHVPLGMVNSVTVLRSPGATPA